MAGEGRPSTSCDARAKEDVDGGAKPRHDGGASPRFSVSGVEAWNLHQIAHSMVRLDSRAFYAFGLDPRVASTPRDDRLSST